MDVAFRRAVAEARRRGELYFAGLLPEDRILEAFGRARWFWQGWIYSPAVTLWVFLAQCLSADHSCREAGKFIEIDSSGNIISFGLQ